VNQRPKLLLCVSALLMGVAISFPMQIMWLYGHTATEMSAVFNKLTFLNYFVMLGCLSCAILAWQASPSLRWSLPLLTMVVGFNNWIVGIWSTDFTLWATFAASLAFSSVNIPVWLSAEVRVLLRTPSLRWWLRADRWRCNVPVVIAAQQKPLIKAQAFDFSASGLFVPLARDTALNVGERVKLQLNLPSAPAFHCEAQVVRRTKAHGQYPEGVGLAFGQLSLRQRRALNTVADYFRVTFREESLNS
jgi:hypothetical protein